MAKYSFEKNLRIFNGGYKIEVEVGDVKMMLKMFRENWELMKKSFPLN